jgi:hypothetical protein
MQKCLANLASLAQVTAQNRRRVFWQMGVLTGIGKIRRVLTFAKLVREWPYVNYNVILERFHFLFPLIKRCDFFNKNMLSKFNPPIYSYSFALIFRNRTLTLATKK